MDALTGLIGTSEGMRVLRARIQRLLDYPQGHPLPPVLIQGETGTGKGLVAQLLHRAGPRRAGPFVDVNCAAIPATLLEAELFGFERGAFTDARRAKPGLFEAADRGTIFLDEVGLLPEASQAKLLKVLDERAVRRLGSTRSQAVDVWIVTATNEDLAAAVQRGTFRDDLFHRLAVLTLSLPPLRERGDDVLILAEHFLAAACSDYALAPKTLSPDAHAALRAYPWPGNVRELSNVIERVALLGEAPLITAAALELPEASSRDRRESSAPDEETSFDDKIGSIERQQFLDALREADGNVSRAAARLGITRNRLRYGIEKLGLRSARRRRRRVRPEPVAAPAAAIPSPKIVESGAPSVARWERRHLAFLRVDLVPEPRADAPPDAGRRLALITEKIQTFGGRVEELGPTVIVAAFGFGPVEDAPTRAALAALAIRRAAEHTRGADPAAPAIKIAVHVGDASVGGLGGMLEIDPESKQAAWTTLAALVGNGEPDAILVSNVAMPFLERRFEFVRIGRSEGGREPCYRLVRREPTGFGLGGRPLTPFVGRQRELEILAEPLAQAERGRGQVVGLVGELGVGKSRFIYEFARPERRPGWRVLICSGASYATTVPFMPFIELLRRYFKIEDADTPSQVREKVTEKVSMGSHDLGADLTPLLALLDVPVDDAQRYVLDPGRRQRILDGVKRLLVAESEIQPLLLVVEDLHWIDEQTQALLDNLVDSLPMARILLLVSYRSEHFHRWASKTGYTQLPIDPLPPEGAEELLQKLLGDDPSLQPVKRLLIERTEGNPLFLEESVRTLAETHALVGERGAYRLATDVRAIQVPATVQAILTARIDRLPPEDKGLLHAAAVVGKDIPCSLLLAVTESPEDELRRGLTRLQAADFLYEARLFPDLEYSFKHTLTHDVAYAGLPEQSRRFLHARIVDVIERTYAERLTEQLDRLAHHAFRGEVWGKAVAFSQQAGARAIARSAFREAVALFEQALGALGHLPTSPEILRQHIDILFDLRHALLPLGQYVRIRGHLQEAEQLAAALQDQHRLGWISCYVSNYCWLVAEHQRGLESGRHALALAAAQGDFALQIAATVRLAQGYHALGDYRQSVALARGVMATVGDDQVREHFGLPGPASVWARAWLTWSLAELGEFAEGIARGEEAMHIAESVDHGYSILVAALGLGLLHLRRGDVGQAIPLFERALTEAEAGDFSSVRSWILSALSRAYILAGRGGELLPVLETSVEQARAKTILWSHSEAVAALAAECLAAGRRDDAARLARESLDLARLRCEQGNVGWSLLLLGELHAILQRSEDAERFYHEAIAVANERAMRPLLAHCQLGRGALFRRLGKPHDARVDVTAAAATFRELGMTFWLARVEAELKELGG